MTKIEMLKICSIAFNAWEMIHGFATVVIDCYFGKVMAYGLQDSVMSVGHISNVLLSCRTCRTKLEFKNVFRHIGWVCNGGGVCMSCGDTDVIAGELRFTVHCSGHGCGDSPWLHSDYCYGYGGTQMDVQTKNCVLTITLIWELWIKLKSLLCYIPHNPNRKRALCLVRLL